MVSRWGGGVHRASQPSGPWVDDDGNPAANPYGDSGGYDPPPSPDPASPGLPDPYSYSVLDAFCGAGTVGVVAARQGRAFVGIDLNPEYLAITRERLAERDRPPKPAKRTRKAAPAPVRVDGANPAA